MRSTTKNSLPLRFGLALALALALSACTRSTSHQPTAAHPASGVPESLGAPTEQCVSCHAAALGAYMDSASPMMRALSDFDPARRDGLAACRSCHGGSALATGTATEAHHHGTNLYGLLSQFTPNPTTDAVVDQVCGVCHRGHVDQVRRSAMNLGPATGDAPSCAGNCHVMEDSHGGQSGCTVCHSPRMLVPDGKAVLDHRLMGSGKRPMARAPLYADEPTVGVPEAGCLQCHTGGYQVALRYMGAATPIVATRGHTIDPAMYQSEHADVHRTRGLQCQDCHTSYDIHGPQTPDFPDNAVEIECADCHGTATMRPWDLPLGYMDAMSDATAPRSTARTVLAIQRHGLPAPRTAEFAGYLRSARGTPLKNVTREGDTAVLYDTQGLRHAVPIPTARDGHDALTATQKECYACHSRTSLRAPEAPLGVNRDHLLAPILRAIGYADGTTLPPAAYTPHDVVRK